MSQNKICQTCGIQNRVQAVFCKNCGTRLRIDATGNRVPNFSDPDNTPEAMIMPEIIGHKELKKLVGTILSARRNLVARGIQIHRNYDMLLLGNSGTGKSTIVKAIAKIFYENGIIKKQEPVIVNAVTTLSEYLKDGDKIINELSDAILCIDSFHGLAHQANGGPIKEIEHVFNDIKKQIEEKGGALVIILVGIDNDCISEYLRNNTNIAANIRYKIELKNYSADEFVDLAEYFLSSMYAMTIAAEAKEKLRRVFKQMFIDKDQRLEQNGKFLLNFLEKVFDKSQERDPSSMVIQSEDIEGKEYIKKTFEEAMSELDNYVGIDEIRQALKRIADSIRAASEDGTDYKLKNHYLFLGNPGTGKTTVARTLSHVLTALEVLPVGHIVEVDRSKLVASYVGETAKTVSKVVEKAMGGILFIDEAYTLIQGDNDTFGKEAVNQLVTELENNRGKFVVIAAGYTNEMRKFIDVNPGLASRFNTTINFRDYNPDELTQIFLNMCSADKQRPYSLDESYKPQLLNYFKTIYNKRGKDFANARTVRNVFEKAIERHNSRIEKLRDAGVDITHLKRILTKEDIEGELFGELTIDEAMSKLNELIGMSEVKATISMLKETLRVEKYKIEHGSMEPSESIQHLVITGNPGTGKTTVAKLLGSIFHAIGLLPTDKVVEKEAKDLRGMYANESAKLINDAVDQAMGGILFIDEAYMLMNIDANGQGDSTGREIVGSLITRMTEDAGKFVLIMAGYPKDMDAFVDKANPGFRRRFRAFLHIDDYTADELYQIFKFKSAKRNYILTSEADRLVRLKIEQMFNTKGDLFGNAGEVDKLLTEIECRQSMRLAPMISSNQNVGNDVLLSIIEDDIPIERPKSVDPSVILSKLDGLIGLRGVKGELKDLINTINYNKILAEKNGRPPKKNLDHYVFMGNPGTGKTTIARIMADIFFSMGLLPSNKLVEVKREDLVAGYVGQTSPKVKQVVQSAMGGILFIDEAYTLSQQHDSFGTEAVNALVPLLLDYKDKFVCIVAGYTDDMNSFLQTNAGLSSRFTKRIMFDDYTPDELTEIFCGIAGKENHPLSVEAKAAVKEKMERLYANRNKHFGNARTAGGVFESVMTVHRNRVMSALADNINIDNLAFEEITIEDINNAK